MPPAASADTLAEALTAARRLRYPVTLRSNANEGPLPTASRERLRDGRMLTRAWVVMVGASANERRREAVIVAKEHVFAASANIGIGIYTDAVFGPVITFGPTGAGRGTGVAVVLPPLNLRLALDMIRGWDRLSCRR